MSGCYGGSHEDRHFERKLNDYLDSTDFGGCQCCEGKQAELNCTHCDKEVCDVCADEDGYCPDCRGECQEEGCDKESGIKCESCEEHYCSEHLVDGLCKDCRE